MTSALHARGVSLAAVVALAVPAAVPAGAQGPGELFPSPFVVEHAVVQTDADGSVFASDPVRDTYGGSWIVSERGDGSRLVVDFARREITEIRPARGTYTVLGFDRMAQLLRELQALEGGGPGLDRSKQTEARPEPQLRVMETGEDAGLKRAASGAAPFEQPGVRSFEVLLEDPSEGTSVRVLQAWFDPRRRFGPAALAALEDLEGGVLGAADGGSATSPARVLALARKTADGALALRTVRPLLPGDDGAGTLEDAASSVEALDVFPGDLLRVPEGFRRAPHPLELMVAHAQREAELRALMGGGSKQ